MPKGNKGYADSDLGLSHGKNSVDKFLGATGSKKQYAPQVKKEPAAPMHVGKAPKKSGSTKTAS